MKVATGARVGATLHMLGDLAGSQAAHERAEV